MTIIVLVIIFVSWILDSFKDAIAFGNSNRWLKETWHVTKLISYALPYGFMLWIVSAPWWVYVFVIANGYLLHEFFYRLFRALDVWRLDRKFNSKLIRRILFISDNDR